jgi:5-methyltetrahydrofolate--homocysteine methyltransferase
MPTVRSRHANRGEAKPLLCWPRSREKALRRRLGQRTRRRRRGTPACSVFESVPLEELRAIIDWTPFFQTWELSGRYPQILDGRRWSAPRRRELFADRRRCSTESFATAMAGSARRSPGLWPRRTSLGDDVRLEDA